MGKLDIPNEGSPYPNLDDYKVRNQEEEEKGIKTEKEEYYFLRLHLLSP